MNDAIQALWDSARPAEDVMRDMLLDDPKLRVDVKLREAKERCNQVAEILREHHDLLHRRVRDFANRRFDAAGYADEITNPWHNHLHAIETIERLNDRIIRTGDRLSETEVSGPVGARRIKTTVKDTQENQDGAKLIEVACKLADAISNFDPRV